MEASNEYVFEKNNPNDKIMWVVDDNNIGDWLFSFDGQRIFNMFQDYPYKLTSEEKDIFDKENPEWANFFKDRVK